MMPTLIILSGVFLLLMLFAFFFAQQTHNKQSQGIMEYLNSMTLQLTQQIIALQTQLKNDMGEYRQQTDAHQIKALTLLQESLNKGFETITHRMNSTLISNTEVLSKRVEKSTATFADVLTRLALIDEAQKKITELSINVVSLQEILADKRARGAFGEVQLSALI